MPNPMVNQGDYEHVFTALEIQPTFDGGRRALNRYLGLNLKYPEKAKREKITGRVYMKFIVTKTGRIVKPIVLKGLGSGCDEEAIRLVLGMPNWKPGLQNGHEQHCYITLPIEFKLE